MKAPRRPARASRALVAEADATLLDLVDNVLTRGVLIEGEVILGLANVDLIYLRLTALLCAPDRLGGGLRPPSSSEGASTAPSEASPRTRLRRQSRRSNGVS